MNWSEFPEKMKKKAEEKKLLEIAEAGSSKEYNLDRLGRVFNICLLSGSRAYTFILHSVNDRQVWAVFIDHIDTEQDFESIEEAMISAVAMAYGQGSKAESLYTKAVLGY